MASCIQPDAYDRHKEFLEERIEPDYGLLDELRRSKALTDREIKGIQHQDTYYDRNSRLLECILKKEKCDLLAEALNETQQTHVVNYLSANGDWQSSYADGWPLMEREMSILDANWKNLLDLLETVDFIARLYATGVINSRQLDFIRSKSASYEKNETILDILRRRSLGDYKRTIQCLRESKQLHIALILEEGGVLIKLHSSHLKPSACTDETEDEIIIKFRSLFEDESPEKLETLNRKLADSGLRVVAVRKSHSIDLYVYFKTMEELIQLKRMQISEKLTETVRWLFIQLLFPRENTYVTVRNLEETVESLFNQILHRSRIAEFIVTLPEDQYHKCLSYRYFPESSFTIRAVEDFKGADIEFDFSSDKHDLFPTTRHKNFIPDPRMALSFRKGDKMKTMSPVDSSQWWRVRHLGNGRVGYIPRSHVVVDYETESICDNSGINRRSEEKTVTGDEIRSISEERKSSGGFLSKVTVRP